MKTVIRYFKQHSKSTLIRFAIITFICLVIVTLTAQGINDTYNRYKDYELRDPYYEYEWSIDPGLAVFVVIIVLLCTLLPMIELAPFNNRKYLDSAFSFPISRISLISVNLLSGFLQFLITYTVCFVWYTIRLIPCADKIGFGALWGFFFVSLLCSLFIYCVNAFFFSVCNFSVDGFLTAIAWQFILCPLVLTVDDIINKNLSDESFLTILWMPLGYISTYFTDLSKGHHTSPDLGTNNKYAMTVYLVLLPFLILLFVAGILYFFNKKRAESAGEVSSNSFSYPTLIPVCVGMLLYWALDGDTAIVSLFALIFSTVGYIIYRRSVKLKIFDIVVIATCFVCFLMGLLA